MSMPTVLSHALNPGRIWVISPDPIEIDNHDFRVIERDDGWSLKPLGWYSFSLISPDGAEIVSVWRTPRGWFSGLFADTGLRQGFTTADKVADYTIENLTCGR